MTKVVDLVKAGYSTAQAETVQAAIDGSAGAAELVAQGFSVTQASAITAQPRVAGDLAAQGIWAATAEIIAAVDVPIYRKGVDFSYVRVFNDHIRFDGEPFSDAFLTAINASIGGTLSIDFSAHPGNSLFPTIHYVAQVQADSIDVLSDTRFSVYFTYLGGDDIYNAQPSVESMSVIISPSTP